MDTEEYAFDCPLCGSPVTFLIDLSISRQNYLEDCEVCCRPIQATVTVSEGLVESFEAVAG